MPGGGGPAAPSPVLYVHSGLDWITGSERCMLDLVAHADRARFTPIVWCNAPTVLAAAADFGATVYSVPGWGSPDALLPERALVAQARAIVRRHGVRLIHANDTAPIRALLPAARTARIPILAHLHLRMTEDERRWSLLHQVALAVGVSQAAVRGLREDGFPASKTAVIYNGVDPARLGRGDARPLRAALGIRPGEAVFATVGSLIPRKGVDVAVRALAGLPAAHEPRCHLVVLGDGPVDAELRQLAAASGVGARVHFLGRRSDVGAVLRDAVDAVITAARDEALPLNVLEAAVLGVPVIASAIEPHVEIIDDGRDGLLFPTDDVGALAAAMHRVAADAPLRRRLGAAARGRAERDFLASRYIAEFERTYDTLLARPPAAYGWSRSWSWPPTYTRWATRMLRRRVARAVGRG